MHNNVLGTIKHALTPGMLIKTHISESQGQVGSSKRCPNGPKTHTREYFGTIALKIEMP